MSSEARTVIETVAGYLAPGDADKAEFEGVLWTGQIGTDYRAPGEPECFRDLNLDQAVDGIVRGRDEYDLRPFFFLPLTDVAQVRGRHDVFRDLESASLSSAIRSFATLMRSMRQCLQAARTVDYRYSSERWFLDATDAYCTGVERLRRGLVESDLQARSLQRLRECLAALVESSRFATLAAETRHLESGLGAIQYSLLIKDGAVTVRNLGAETDYGPVVDETLAKLGQGAESRERTSLPPPSSMNHIHAQVLERVALLNPEVFAALEDFPKRYGRFLDEAVVRFDREIQFYLAYLDFTEPLKHAGLKLCYPDVARGRKQVQSRDSFDLALASKLVGQGVEVVSNDFHLEGNERILVVTGPNQGGKTTFARAFGQLCYLASLGCPVPGTEARLPLLDRVLTQFEREETVANRRGKLEDDLWRMRKILSEATPDSVVILNEMFASTTATDALELGRRILQRIMDRDLLCVCVTFLDELSRQSDKTVSMVAAVAPDDPARRTYKVQRRPADGRAYALVIVEKYRLSPDKLQERMKR